MLILSGVYVIVVWQIVRSDTLRREAAVKKSFAGAAVRLALGGIWAYFVLPLESPVETFGAFDLFRVVIGWPPLAFGLSLVYTTSRLDVPSRKMGELGHKAVKGQYVKGYAQVAGHEPSDRHAEIAANVVSATVDVAGDLGGNLGGKR